MYSVGAGASAIRWSSSYRLREDTERGSRCSDSWSSCNTSGKDSSYWDWKKKKAERHCLKHSSGPLGYPYPVLYCALSPFLLWTPHSSFTGTHLILSPRTHREQAHAGEISISRCCCSCCNPCAFVIECMCVCVCKKGRKRVGWWVDEWVDRAKGGRRRGKRRRRRGESWGKVQSR